MDLFDYGLIDDFKGQNYVCASDVMMNQLIFDHFEITGKYFLVNLINIV